jgi:hypothetical protein
MCRPFVAHAAHTPREAAVGSSNASLPSVGRSATARPTRHRRLPSISAIVTSRQCGRKVGVADCAIVLASTATIEFSG